MLIEDVNQLLLQYASGNFSKRGIVTGTRDDMDALISGINMLGEELQDSTVSKNYFMSVFNAVNDMIIVLEKNNRVHNMNRAAYRFLGYSETAELSMKLEDFFSDRSEPVFIQLKKELRGKEHYAFDSYFRSLLSGIIPVHCSCSKIVNKSRQTEYYLVVARDTTEQKKAENMILHAIVETQENEQKRVAEDLHDSLGQQLSAIRYFLNSFQSKNDKDVAIGIDSFNSTLKIIDDAISNLRYICFNLLPGSLSQCGLADSIHQLVFMLNTQDKIKIRFSHDDGTINLKKEAEISMYRVVQEFLNNSLKHSEAKNIRILLTTGDYVMIQLSDDGKGFDTGKKNVYKGNGLNNMNSRMKAFKGEFKLVSEKGKGTQVTIKIPNHAGGNPY